MSAEEFGSRHQICQFYKYYRTSVWFRSDHFDYLDHGIFDNNNLDCDNLDDCNLDQGNFNIMNLNYNNQDNLKLNLNIENLKISLVLYREKKRFWN